MTGTLTLGLDIGGTKTLAALIDEHGRASHVREAATPAQSGPRAVLDNAISLAREALGDTRVTAIGVGSAGVIETDIGVVLSATGALRDWAGTDLQGAILAEFPTVTVRVLNDVQAFTVAEGHHGAAAGARLVLGVMVGTGIGGGLIVNGEVVTGAHSATGHIGHILVPPATGIPCPCGRSGHVESVASGPAMTEAFRRLGGTATTLAEVAAAAERGDKKALQVLADGADAVGLAVGSIANVIDPDVVVIGGGVTNLGSSWIDRVREAAHTTTIPALGDLRIEQALLGSTAVAIGAAYEARARRVEAS